MPAALLLQKLLLQGLLQVRAAPSAAAAVCALPLAAADAAVGNSSPSCKGGGELLPGVPNDLQSPLPSLVVAAAADAVGADTTLPAAVAGSVAVKFWAHDAYKLLSI
jgi:hypothetical protein